MMGWTRYAICALGCAMALAGAPALAKTIATFDVRGWNASVFTDDDTGAFSSCAATAEYRSGMGLGFLIGDDYSWSLSLFDTPTSFKKGQNVTVAFQIDGGEVRKVTAKAIETRFLYVPLEDDVDLFDEFRGGRMLRVSVAGKVVGFKLDGTSAMLAALLDCAKKYNVQAQASASEPPKSKSRKDSSANRDSSGKNAPASQVTSTGSGFFVSADGAVLTNAHVVEGCEDAVIAGYGKARIAATDTTNDLALLKLAGPVSTTPVRFRRKPLQLGETAYVMGFPLAGQLDNGLNFTSGTVSSLAGPGNDTRTLQFTAPIQEGNSGGPIVDSAGLLVGVTQAKLNEVAAIKDGSFPQNVNFGIKTDLAANFLRANNVDPVDVISADPQTPVAVARDGRAYTVQVKCSVK